MAVWCRGKVVSVRGTVAEVWMLDHADLVRLPLTSLKILLPEFCKLPALVERRELVSKQQGEWVKMGKKCLMDKSQKAPPAQVVMELKLRDQILAAMVA